MKEVSTAAEEVKTKFLPLLDEAMHLSRTGRLLLEDAGPKVKTIGENLVKTTESLMETGRIARGAVEKIDGTLSDANTRAKRQVARVDGMITAALTTTAEVAETISNGIKGPALRIAAMVSQAKGMAEGILSKVKGRAAASGFGQREWPE
jgi:Glu-tRNA(Gln) amidotransferase subunit E-like FAD-binding protein